MVVTTTKPVLSIREELKRNQNPPAGPPFQTFEAVGDASTTTFTIVDGWKPLAVYDAGSRQTEGSGDDYTVTFDGFVYSVVFATAPTNLHILLWDCWRSP